MHAQRDCLKGLRIIWLYSDILSKVKPWQPKIDVLFPGSASLGWLSPKEQEKIWAHDGNHFMIPCWCGLMTIFVKTCKIVHEVSFIVYALYHNTNEGGEGRETQGRPLLPSHAG